LVDTYGPAIAGAVTAKPSRATANAFICLFVNYLVVCSDLIIISGSIESVFKIKLS